MSTDLEVRMLNIRISQNPNVNDSLLVLFNLVNRRLDISDGSTTLRNDSSQNVNVEV